MPLVVYLSSGSEASHPHPRPPLSEPSKGGPPGMTATPSSTHGLQPTTGGGGGQSSLSSMSNSSNKGFSGQDFLSHGRGNLDKKPGIFRQGSLGQEPQHQHHTPTSTSSHTASVSGGMGPFKQGMMQDKLGAQMGAPSQPWSGTQGPSVVGPPMAPTSQGITKPSSGGPPQTSKSNRSS